MAQIFNFPDTQANKSHSVDEEIEWADIDMDAVHREMDRRDAFRRKKEAHKKFTNRAMRVW